MRNELRFLANAMVYVIDKASNQSEASLSDLSEHGLSIKSQDFIDIVPNSPYVVVIVPDKETNLKKFQMEIESRWVKLNRTKVESGFSVIVPFNEQEFKDYLAYLEEKEKANPVSEDHLLEIETPEEI